MHDGQIMISKDRKPTTTDGGTTVTSDEHSLIIGTDGPILLQDHYLNDQMVQFYRELIPEHQTHARGNGLFGPGVT